MSRPPEFAFLTAEPLASPAGARTVAHVRALCALGYDTRAYSSADAPLDEPALRGARAVVFDMAGMPAGPALELARRATVLSASSDALAAQASRALGREVHYLPDVAAGAPGEARAARARGRSRPLEWLARRAGLATDPWRIRLLWWGEKTGLEALVGAYVRLQQMEIPLELKCLATPAVLEQFPLREEAVRLALQAWSPAALAEALGACDFVLLPETEAQLLEALNAGRLPLARAAQYGKLGEFAWLGEDPAEGLRWALAHPHEVLERLRRARNYIDEVHAPGAVAPAWTRILMKGQS